MAALPYMQLYVAEYLADTMHLTAAQHGAYLLLLMNYWQRGKALPANDARLAVVAHMTAKEWASSRDVIAEFFTVTETEWIHGRVDRDLAEVLKKSDTNKANGSRGGRPKKPNGYANGLPNGSENETETKGNRTEQIRTDNPPLPPGGEKPDQTAKRVMTQLKLSNDKLFRVITDVCRMDQLIPADVRCQSLVESWNKYQEAKPSLDYSWGAEKFFGEGYWRDAKTWPWKEGQAPAAVTKRRYIGDEPEQA